MLSKQLVLALSAIAVSPQAHGAPIDNASVSSFVTLGTMGGPVPSALRSQPANVLLRGTDAYLIDVGDGAVEQLAKAGIRVESVKAIFLSHLHFDHTGGLAAFLGLRYQANVAGSVTIYGPPGTRQLVDGLVQSMRPAAEAGYGTVGAKWIRPADTVTVIELIDGSRFSRDGITVTAAQNSHYDFAPGSAEDARFKSLSFRFDMPDRSIAYTGDTGPSAAVARLARGADVLVSEMIDLQTTMDTIHRNSPNMPEAALSGLVDHLSRHHLTAEQVGKLAAEAGVKLLVVTHFAGGTPDPVRLKTYEPMIRTQFGGGVKLANDLDRF